MFKKVVKKEKTRQVTVAEEDDSYVPIIGTKRPNPQATDDQESEILTIQNQQDADSDNDPQQLQQNKKHKRHKGISIKSIEERYQQQIKDQGESKERFVREAAPTEQKGVGLISAGGKQPSFQFTSLGKFEIKDKKLEEFLQSKLPQKGKSDYELEHERRQKEHAAAKLRIAQEQRDLYKIPEHLDVDKLQSDRRLIDQTNWVNGLIEVPVSQDKKIQNVEDAEKLRLQQLKRVFNVEESNVLPERMAFNAKESKKNDLQKLLDQDRHQLRSNREKQKGIQAKRDTNRQQEEYSQQQLHKKPDE